MRRLFWIGVGVGATVIAVRYGRRLVAQYVPPQAAQALGTAAKVTGTVRGVFRDVAAGVAEREAELRTALLGEDADPAAIKARGRAAWAELRSARGPAAGSRGVPPTWASGSLEDPDDDDGYTFF